MEEWREDEQDTKHAKKIPIRKINKASKSICKIIMKGKGGNGVVYGTGFFMYIIEENKKLECLITNYHNINEKIINITIKIQINNNNEYKIKLDNSIRYIKFFKRPIDITIIQILNSDNFKNDIEFFYYDLNYMFGYEQYLNNDIFTIEHPLGGEVEYASGKVIKIMNNFEFEHSIDTDYGSSGSPIILHESLKVIGIHKQRNKLNNNNIGTFIGEIFKVREKDKNEIFQSDEFNNLSLDEFYDKYKNHSQIKELMDLKNIHHNIAIECKLTKNMLDARGNKIEGWEKGEMRGGRDYDPPIDWIAIGLKVLGGYENDLWLGKNNIPEEWCVAYHGVAYGQSSEKVLDAISNIYKGGFKPGPNQAHKHCIDIFHPGCKVGEGVYFCPTINIAQEYGGVVCLNGKKYRVVLMNRISPSKIRGCICMGLSNYNWVVNGTTEEIRPYRILLKMV